MTYGMIYLANQRREKDKRKQEFAKKKRDARLNLDNKEKHYGSFTEMLWKSSRD